MPAQSPYPIGTTGVPWGLAEVMQWRAAQRVQRAYADDVLAVIERLRADWEVTQYGQLQIDPARYPLFALRSRHWDERLPIALVTGGVHGYETSGVHGALRFAEHHAAAFAGRVNLIVAPCVSPWAYETIQRWDPHAVDPNRAFRDGGTAQEAQALMAFLAPWRDRIAVHVDLHETTDSDETEFRLARAARDGLLIEPDLIPDGFYLVDDAAAPQPEFQAAIIEAVARVTHIAPADAQGRIIGSDVVSPGVIRYALAGMGLCAGFTAARYRTTTEVYPDSPRTTPEACIAAQVAAAVAAIDYVLQQPSRA
jgi:hypothetical protein